MRLNTASVLAVGLLAVPTCHGIGQPIPGDPKMSPFDPIDRQEWINPDNMTARHFKRVPGTSYSDPNIRGSIRNFNIALIAVDYQDLPFVVTLPTNSTVFNNPQPAAGLPASGIPRDQVPKYYQDLLNYPNVTLNNNHTLHEYWMTDSFGKYGVDLTAFGPYRLPALSWQYGIDPNGFNPGACPKQPCGVDIRTDALKAWRAQVGNETAAAFELVFILSAGQDESSTWQEFGEMKFAGPQQVPPDFGPPAGLNSSLSNWASTRYVNWTSWAAAATIWPNAGGGSSTQAESSGMGTYAHELSHLLGIGDNYNNPYSSPARRAYSGPFSMLDRGSFNGAGGPHTRWKIPALEGGSMGSLHTLRDKLKIGLIHPRNVLNLSRDALAYSGVVIVPRIPARAVDPDTFNGSSHQYLGIRIDLGPRGDLSWRCNISTDPLCDGGGYQYYDIEVVDRMGPDSFCPDHGVMISKTKTRDSPQPFQWVIDANPQDINMVDFVRPGGQEKAMITIGDYRQLSDALFHAGTNSGSQFEYIDEANRLHIYIVDVERDTMGILSYTIAVRSLDDHLSLLRKSQSEVYLGQYGEEDERVVDNDGGAHRWGTPCWFELKHKGKVTDGGVNATHPGNDVTPFLKGDVYRLSASVSDKGWKVAVPNELVVADEGETVMVYVAAGVDKEKSSVPEAAFFAVVTLTATSESDPTDVDTAQCVVGKDYSLGEPSLLPLP
ncbi:M6 family metalloprotease domain-containing protein [Rhypophila decipiens]|uniref:M6 family metalloprotease domain-containing protein n=1 Tax=Rhypophila decipiens TaxID=261697 RepID=A0AAN7B9G9_9PEZI|nr:M6 family metalloprotease domain-containing protein [Rhypophila decipiens]